MISKEQTNGAQKEFPNAKDLTSQEDFEEFRNSLIEAIVKASESSGGTRISGVVPSKIGNVRLKELQDELSDKGYEMDFGRYGSELWYALEW